MKDFNAYEKALIKDRINPNVCVMSSGAEWNYISNLKDTHYANITVIGSDPKLIAEYDMLKDYDIIILDSIKPFMDSSLDELINIAGIINMNYNKDVAMVYSFIKDNKKIAVKFISDQNGLNDLGFIEGSIDLRTMLDDSYKVLNPVKQKKKKKSK